MHDQLPVGVSALSSRAWSGTSWMQACCCGGCIGLIALIAIGFIWAWVATGQPTGLWQWILVLL